MVLCGQLGVVETKVGEEAINHKEVVSHDHLICNALYSEVFNQVSHACSICCNIMLIVMLLHQYLSCSMPCTVRYIYNTNFSTVTNTCHFLTILTGYYWLNAIQSYNNHGLPINQKNLKYKIKYIQRMEQQVLLLNCNKANVILKCTTWAACEQP